ncbi:MAG: ECF transporter S component [Lachnospiraceae bacterium]|nr:ECF transporter S component [Lachnospiraceae bacterium]
MIFERYYILISLILIAGSLALVFARLDKRRTGVRRITLIAVMTALSIVGRFIFASLPAFKPVSAIVILTGIYLGGEAGFLVGSLCAFLSNFYFGQGPWTPFQMAALGIIGLLAGLFFQKRSFKSPIIRRIVICIYAAVSGIFYSLFLDTWTMLWTYGSLNGPGYLAACLAAIPYTALYVVSNVLFFILLDIPFGKRLGRIISKYKI